MGPWIAVLVVLYLSVAASVVAARTGRSWIVVPAALPIALSIVLSLLGLRLPANPLFSIAIGLGFVLLATLGGSPLVALVLSLATRTVRLGTHGGILVSDVDSPLPDREILRGSRCRLPACGDAHHRVPLRPVRTADAAADLE